MASERQAPGRDPLHLPKLYVWLQNTVEPGPVLHLCGRRKGMRFSRWNEGEKTYMMLCKISLCKRIAALVTGVIIWEE